MIQRSRRRHRDHQEH